MRFRELSNSAKSSGDQPKLATRASTHLAAHSASTPGIGEAFVHGRRHPAVLQ